MATEEEAKRNALLAMQGIHPQSGPNQEQIRQQQTPARDLSQVRPTVIRAVGEQEKRAEQVVTATWQLFRDAMADDPALRKAVKDSSLGTLLG